MAETTKLERLVAMMQQIAENNRHHGGVEQNAEVIASHIIRFWARPMKQMLLDHWLECSDRFTADTRLAIQKVADHCQRLNKK